MNLSGTMKLKCIIITYRILYSIHLNVFNYHLTIKSHLLLGERTLSYGTAHKLCRELQGYRIPQ